MKKLLLFLARLFAVSLLFVPVLPMLRHAYRFMMALVATTVAPTEQTMAALPYDGSGNLYTFLVLILATPGLSTTRRISGIATGICMFLSADLFMTAVWQPYIMTPRPSLANMAVSYGWLVTAHYLLPFLLWLAFSFRQIESLLKGQMQGEGTA